jgi:DnaA-homolog protein
MMQLPLAMRLRERAVFDSFVPGPNLEACARLRAVGAGAEAGVCWLYGPAGAGKSHLLQAVCAEAQRGGATSAYLPLALLRVHGLEVLEGWQNVSVLALDDLGSIAGHAAWEQGVFGLHREAQERGTALIAAAEVPPTLMHFSLPDLASRFAAAVLLPLRPLDEAGQRAALRLRAHARGLELPESTALYLQRRFRRDLSTLYDLLDTLDEAALRTQRRLTVPFIRSVLMPRTPDA